MSLLLLFWSLFLAFLAAHLEVNIEGKNGWAKKLPTWRIQNRFTSTLFSGAPLTGYHFWAFITFFSVFHLPFFFGVAWTPVIEIQVVIAFFVFAIAEDFLWFVVNPRFGLKRFNKKHALWYKMWFLGLPIGYYKAAIIVSCLLYISSNLSL